MSAAATIGRRGKRVDHVGIGTDVAYTSRLKPPDVKLPPRTTFVANFLGRSNLIACRIVARDNDDLQRVIDDLVSDDDVVRTSTLIALSTVVSPRVMPLVAAAAVARCGDGRGLLRLDHLGDLGAHDLRFARGLTVAIVRNQRQPEQRELRQPVGHVLPWLAHWLHAFLLPSIVPSQAS